MSDAELRASIATAADEVAEQARREDSTTYEIHFAAGTLQRLTHELRLRDAAASDAADIVPA